MDVGSPFVADAQAAKGMEPGDGALHDPAVSAQPLLGFNTAPSDPGADTPPVQVVAAEGKVVAFVGVQLDGPTAWPSALSRNRGGLIEEGDEVPGIVVVGARQPDRERQPLPINEQVMLAAPLGPIGRIGADAFAAEGGKARWTRRGCSGASRFSLLDAGVSENAGANAPRHRPPAIPAAFASRSYHCRSPFPAAALPTGCPS